MAVARDETSSPVLCRSFGESVFPFFLSLIFQHSREPEVSWPLPLLISGSPFELVLSLTDIFQKLAAVKEQREWVTASGAHKVSGPQGASAWVHLACVASLYIPKSQARWSHCASV